MFDSPFDSACIQQSRPLEGIPDLVLISEAPMIAEIESQTGFHEVAGWEPPDKG
jgi:hypothetical protein